MSSSGDLSKLIVDFAEDASVTRLGEMVGAGQDGSPGRDFICSPIASELPVLGHWMSFILLTGDSVRIVFKVHFMSQSAKQLAARTYGITPAECTKERAIDFVREYCNLVMGTLKTGLKAAGIDLNGSLPITTRGFDDIYSESGRSSEIHRWTVRSEDAAINCSIDFSIRDSAKIHDPNILSSVEESGDVDFL